MPAAKAFAHCIGLVRYLTRGLEKYGDKFTANALDTFVNIIHNGRVNFVSTRHTTSYNVFQKLAITLLTKKVAVKPFEH